MTRFIVLALLLTLASAFVPQQPQSCVATSRLFADKGFGSKPESSKKPQKSAAQVQREKAGNRYDEISAAGGQEYSVFVRQFGSDEKSWLPCGSIAIPRNEQVSDAIYANESPLKASIVRTYPKLRGNEDEMEFGYNLKIYPDDPIEVAVKGKGKKSSGLSIGNWISTLLSPVDTSKVKPPN